MSHHVGFNDVAFNYWFIKIEILKKVPPFFNFLNVIATFVCFLLWNLMGWPFMQGCGTNEFSCSTAMAKRLKRRKVKFPSCSVLEITKSICNWCYLFSIFLSCFIIILKWPNFSGIGWSESGGVSTFEGKGTSQKGVCYKEGFWIGGNQSIMNSHEFTDSILVCLFGNVFATF